MSAGSSRRLAWTLAIVSVGLVAVAAGFDVVNAAHDRGDPWLPSIAAAAIGFGAVGGLVAAQQPHNPIGWMLLAIGVGHAVSGATIGFGTWAATTGRPGAGVALWLGNWAWLPLAGLPAVLLLFPTGRLRSRRLRPVLIAALALPPLLIAGVAV
jgi:two-component system NarL family sensor kinase